MTGIKKSTSAVAVVLVLACVFEAGRRTASTLCSGTTSDIKTDTSSQKDEDKHVVTVVTEEPGGKKTTTVTEDTKTKTVKDSTKSKEVTVAATKKNNISLLIGYDVRVNSGMSYGASLTHQIEGPISVGVFGLTSGMVGVSIGLEF